MRFSPLWELLVEHASKFAHNDREDCTVHCALLHHEGLEAISANDGIDLQ